VGGRPVTLLNAGFRADADSPGLSGPVPDLGSDTDDVLRELGYAADEIARLRAEGAI
jgi:formyl-CoA transferase